MRDNFSDMTPEDVWIRIQGEPPSTLSFELCADLLTKTLNPQFTMGATYYKGKRAFPCNIRRERGRGGLPVFLQVPREHAHALVSLEERDARLVHVWHQRLGENKT